MVTSRKKSARDQALAAGAVDYLTKPFELDELLSHINSALSTDLARIHNDKESRNVFLILS